MIPYPVEEWVREKKLGRMELWYEEW